MPFNRLTAMLATAVAPMLWGTTYLVFTQTLPVDHPLLVGALRALPAGVLLMLLGPGLPPRDKLLPLLFLGLANIGVFFALLFVAELGHLHIGTVVANHQIFERLVDDSMHCVGYLAGDVAHLVGGERGHVVGRPVGGGGHHPGPRVEALGEPQLAVGAGDVLAVDAQRHFIGQRGVAAREAPRRAFRALDAQRRGDRRARFDDLLGPQAAAEAAEKSAQ